MSQAKQMPARKRIATTAGIFALLFWGMTVAFSRSLTQQLGVLTAACYIYIGSGAIGLLYVLANPRERARLAQIPRRFWLACGMFFVLNVLCFHMAVGLAAGGQKIVEIGLINYLWISFTLLLSVPILGKKARLGLAPGIVIACVGICIAALQREAFSWNLFAENMRTDRMPYVLAFCGALSWAFYSNLTGKWGANIEGRPLPVFLLAAGVVFLAIRMTVTESSVWSTRVFLELAATIAFPTILSYFFWDFAMRKGNAVLVVSTSYLTPLLSTIISCLYLRIPPKPALLLACVMVIGGAVLCRKSVVD